MKSNHLFYLGFLLVFSLAANAQSATGAATNTVLGTSTMNPWASSSPTSALRNTLLGCEINGSATAGSYNLGSDNVFVGYHSGYYLKDAELNSSLGSNAGYSNVYGDRNVNIGAYSGYSHYSASDNISIGAYSGYANANNLYNVFVGGYSGRNNTADGSTFVGFNSGLNNTTGTKNAFLGYEAGKANTIGELNTFLGYQAGNANIGTATVGKSNTYVGATAGAANTNGSANVFVGSEAGQFGTTGSYNMFIGEFSGRNTDGGANVFIGHASGLGNTSGTSNVCIGHVAGGYTTGSANVFIGAGCNVTTSSGNLSNKLLIESNPGLYSPPPTALVYGDFLNRKVGIGLRSLFTANADGFPTTINPSGPSLTSCKLFVDGGIVCTSNLIVSAFTNWADYVFEEKYSLSPLQEVEKYIQENGHLKNIPSAKEVEQKGLDLPAMSALQQEKIEELTLYLIQQDKEIQALKEQNKEIQEQLKIVLNKKQ